VLRYHGGKFIHRGWIVSHFPPHRIYVESFGGAASVLLAKPRCSGEVYNDLDGSVVALFRVLRDQVACQKLVEQLRLTPFAREEYEKARRADVQAETDQVEAARLLVCRSFMGQGTEGTMGSPTGFRANSWGSHRSAPADWSNFPETLHAVCTRLRGVVIEHGDAVAIMQRHDSPTTLHYVDPPYLPSTRGRMRGYNHEMTEEGHRQLAEALRSLTGTVVLSGYPSTLYDQDLYPDWQRAQRRSFADGARKRMEVLWSNRPFHGRLDLGEALPEETACP
jgi:DNA adenine methylase